jgi:flagellar basal body L-ring protein FlgH
MANKYDELFERWLDLDKEKRMLVFSGIFGRMTYSLKNKIKSDKAAAEEFFEEVEYIIEQIEEAKTDV